MSVSGSGFAARLNSPNVREASTVSSAARLNSPNVRTALSGFRRERSVERLTELAERPNPERPNPERE